MGARVVELESQLITAADVNNLLQSTLQPITERLSRLEEAPMVSVAHAAKGAQGSTGESFSAVCAQLLEMRGKLAAVEQSVAVQWMLLLPEGSAHDDEAYATESVHSGT